MVPRGRLAQLVARFVHTEEVIGSSPVSPTAKPPDQGNIWPGEADQWERVQALPWDRVGSRAVTRGKPMPTTTPETRTATTRHTRTRGRPARKRPEALGT